MNDIDTAAALFGYLNRMGQFAICNVRDQGRVFTHIIWQDRGGEGGHYERHWAGAETLVMLEDAAAFVMALKSPGRSLN